MRKKLLAMNLALLVLLGLFSAYLREAWMEARAREQRVLAAKLVSVKVPQPPAIPRIQPLVPTAYKDVAMNMLFARDRNPTVILDPVVVPPPKPVPAFPSAYGVMSFGDVPPTVILSKKGSTDQKGYQAGETIGDFKIASVTNEQVVFEWEGKQFPKKIEELIEKPAAPQPGAANHTAGAAPAAAGVTALGAPRDSVALAPNRSGPGASMGADLKACQAGDSAPAGSVVDGMKKVVSESPFGTVCRWEKQ